MIRHQSLPRTPRRTLERAFRRASTIAVFAVVMLTMFRASAQKSPTAQAAFARAQEHLAAGHFAEAATAMETAVRFEPRFALGWYVLASSKRRAGQCDEAVFAYRRYMELRPTEPDPYFGAGLCLSALGDAEGATAAFRRYVAMDVRPASREFVEIARRNLADLERNAAATAKVPPRAPPASLIEARQNRDHGRIEEAITMYKAAIAADGKSSEAHAELGALLVSERRVAEAADVLRTAVRLAPSSATAWYNLAFALRESGQAENAVQAYRRYITFKPKDPDPHYGLGRALARLGRTDEAVASFKMYTTLETRPTERQWVRKARAEIARLESTQHDRPLATTPAKPVAASTPPPPAMRAFPSTQPGKAASSAHSAATPSPASPPPAASTSPVPSPVKPAPAAPPRTTPASPVPPPLKPAPPSPPRTTPASPVPPPLKPAPPSPPSTQAAPPREP